MRDDSSGKISTFTCQQRSDLKETQLVHSLLCHTHKENASLASFPGSFSAFQSTNCVVDKLDRSLAMRLSGTLMWVTDVLLSDLLCSLLSSHWVPAGQDHMSSTLCQTESSLEAWRNREGRQGVEESLSVVQLHKQCVRRWQKRKGREGLTRHVAWIPIAVMCKSTYKHTTSTGLKSTLFIPIYA